jgi:hypothetical protein
MEMTPERLAGRTREGGQPQTPGFRSTTTSTRSNETIRGSRSIFFSWFRESRLRGNRGLAGSATSDVRAEMDLSKTTGPRCYRLPSREVRGAVQVDDDWLMTPHEPAVRAAVP